MKLVNLTPHVINVLNQDEVPVMDVAPSGEIARVASSSVKTGEIDGVPFFETELGVPEGVPSPSDGVIYIVSGLLRAACPDRLDLVQPGRLVRDETGKPVGCVGLSR